MGSRVTGQMAGACGPAGKHRYHGAITLWPSRFTMTDDSATTPIVDAIKRGELATAERLCRAHLQAQGEDPDVLLLLGLGLQQQNRDAEALAPYRRLTELVPRKAVHWANYATALQRAGDPGAAVRAVEAAMRLAPEDPERLDQSGLLRLQLDQPRAAQATLLKAATLAPGSAAIRIHAARACVACRDRRADELLLGWRDWTPLADDLRLDLADLLVQISEPWDAMELLEDLVRRVPTDWPTQLLLAKVYERVNRPEQAESKLQWIAAMVGMDTDDALAELQPMLAHWGYDARPVVAAAGA